MKLSKIGKYLKYNYKAVISLVVKILLWCCLFALIGALLLFAHYGSNVPSYSQTSTVWQYLWCFVLDNAPVIGIISSSIVLFRPFFHILRYGFIDAAIETLTQHVLYLEQLVEVFTGIFCSRFLICCLCHSPCKN